MAGPDLAAEAAEELAAAYPGSHEANLAAALLAPLQRMADIVLDEAGPFASVFARTIVEDSPLGWAAMWAGVDPATATTDELRDATFLRSRWRRGTVPAVTAAIESVLTGDRNVRLYERRDPADFDADAPYHLSIVTSTSETPGGVDSIVAALRGILPARYVLHIALVDGLSWQDLVDSERTWQDVLDDFEDWQHVYNDDPI